MEGQRLSASGPLRHTLGDEVFVARNKAAWRNLTVGYSAHSSCQLSASAPDDSFRKVGRICTHISIPESSPTNS